MLIFFPAGSVMDIITSLPPAIMVISDEKFKCISSRLFAGFGHTFMRYWGWVWVPALQENRLMYFQISSFKATEIALAGLLSGALPIRIRTKFWLGTTLIICPFLPKAAYISAGALVQMLPGS